MIDSVDDVDLDSDGNFEEIHICSWTVQGLVSKRRNKLRNPGFLKYNNQYDIILCTETWTNKLGDLNIAGYNNVAIYRARRPGTKRDSRGIVLFLGTLNMLKCLKQRMTVFYGYKFQRK